MKRLFLATAALTLLLTACGAEKVEEPAQDVQAQETQVEDVTQVQEEESLTIDDLAFMNEDAILNDVTYKVVALQANQQMAGYISEGGVYLAIQLQITNNSKQAIDLSNNDFQLFSDGAQYAHDSTVTAYHDKGFTFEKVNPGMSLTASIVYEIPLTVIDAGAILQIQPNQFKEEATHIVLSQRQ